MTEASGDPTGSGGVRSIPTEYAGVTFRSRLEATWAYNLDAWGIRWSYEPEGVILPSGARYLPDFWLPEIRTWLEVKGPGVGGLEKTEELAAVSTIVVIGRAPIGAKADYSVSCLHCKEFMPTGYTGEEGGAGLGMCWRSGKRQFLTEHFGCGLDARCQIHGNECKTYSHAYVHQAPEGFTPWRQMQWQPNGSGR